MKILLFQDGTARIGDADDFKAFSVQVTAGTDLSNGFAGVVSQADGEHTWIDLGWLRSALDAHDGDRRTKLDSMVAFAQSRGWVTGDPPAVRGHIEWVDGS